MPALTDDQLNEKCVCGYARREHPNGRICWVAGSHCSGFKVPAPEAKPDATVQVVAVQGRY